MDVILHVGVHRTGSTSFQNYMRANRARLDGQAYGFWGPWRTRNGMLADVLTQPKDPISADRAMGRVRLNLDKSRKHGMRSLLVSDENMIGAPRRMLRAGALYPDIGERMARLSQAFDRPTKIVMQIRSLENWWASMCAHLVGRGEALPDAAHITRLAQGTRSWRHVITDLACACPDSDIVVTPFERFAGRPDLMFHRMTGAPVFPICNVNEFWSNRSPDLAQLREITSDLGLPASCLPAGDGRWMPFDHAQAAALRETYADDLFWLRSGADGLATLIEDPEPNRPRVNLAAALTERGRHHDGSARELARARRERAARPRG